MKVDGNQGFIPPIKSSGCVRTATVPIHLLKKFCFPRWLPGAWLHKDGIHSSLFLLRSLKTPRIWSWGSILISFSNLNYLPKAPVWATQSKLNVGHPNLVFHRFYEFHWGAKQEASHPVLFRDCHIIPSHLLVCWHNSPVLCQVGTIVMPSLSFEGQLRISVDLLYLRDTTVTG